MYKEQKECRICQGTLKQVFDLGNQYVVDFPTSQAGAHLQVPLVMAICEKCGVAQLTHTVMPDRLFKHFWYRSGISEVMKAALRSVVGGAIRTADLTADDKVLDIGCNDGTMLSMYPAEIRTVGIDPCRELVREGVDQRRMEVGIVGYFSARAVPQFAPFKVITAIAMFYDLENPGQFLDDCRQVLHDDGVLIIQMNYLKMMVENMALDNISHEHLMYYSLTTLKQLVEAHELEIAGVETNDVNGGSIRAYIVHKGCDVSNYRLTAGERVKLHVRMQSLLLEEERMGLNTAEIWKTFAERAEQIKQALRRCILTASKNEKVYAYGASTRGTVTMQYLDLPAGTIVAVAERDPHKFDHMMVGTWTPIVPEKQFREEAMTALVLPWHFMEGIKLREKEWLQNGGRFIVPFPVPKLVTADGEYAILPATYAGGAQ